MIVNGAAFVLCTMAAIANMHDPTVWTWLIMFLGGANFGMFITRMLLA